MDRRPNPVPCLSVVVPCFNEEATIKELLGRVLDSPWVQEVIVVDDCSTDLTRELVRSVGDDRVTLLEQTHNQGKGAALRRGFGHASADFVIIQDADLEYDPADYESLVEPLLTPGGPMWCSGPGSSVTGRTGSCTSGIPSATAC